MAPLRHLVITAAVIAAAASAAPPVQAVELHAHRGGALANGMPAAYENSLSAFKTAPGRGARVVELDVHVSKDGVPFVMHEGPLDRRTDCTGAAADHTAAELDACPIDRLVSAAAFKEAPGSTEP